MPAYRDDRSDEIAAAIGDLPEGSPVSGVANRLIELLTSGAVAPGTRLPPERRLAESLGVGRSAIREALAALELLGMVEVRHGAGSYARGTVSELLPRTLRWTLLLGERSSAELLELRSALEIYAARLAAERIDDAGIERMSGCLRRMRSGIDGDREGFVEADRRFHRELTAAAGNTVLVDQLQTIRSLVRVWSDRAVRDEEQARIAAEEHAAVLEALRRRDPDGAAAAMALHMTTATRRLGASGDRPAPTGDPATP